MGSERGVRLPLTSVTVSERRNLPDFGWERRDVGDSIPSGMSHGVVFGSGTVANSVFVL